MSGKLCPKVILEGTRLTLKTELAFSLNEHPRIVGPRKYRYHSPIISAEWCAFANFPWGRGLVNFSTEEEDRALETYRTWVRLFELQPYYSWIVDRFHVSTQVHQYMVNRHRYDFRWLEERLNPLGFRIVFCTRSADSFEAAREERVKVSGNPSQYKNLEVFRREQDVFAEVIARSLLPSLTLDISDGSVTGATERIADWLAATGGLYVP